MKITQLSITKSSEIEPGMILTPAYFDEAYIILRRPFQGEKIRSDQGKVVEIDTRLPCKFWAIPLSNPEIQPVFVCTDLVFDPEKFKVFKIEP